MAEFHQFVKGSKWRTRREITSSHNRVIPAGSVFTVPYPRRRESEVIMIALEDRDIIKRQRAKKRFPQSDLGVPFSKIHDAELIAMPEHATEYFVRDRATGLFWEGGRFRPSRFNGRDITTANNYVSLQNAITGVSLIVTRQRAMDITSDDPWEIVHFNPVSGEIEGVMPIPEPWFHFMRRMGVLLKTMKKRETAGLRNSISHIPTDHTEYDWNVLMMRDAGNTSTRNEMAKFDPPLFSYGQTYYYRDHTEATLLKIMCPNVFTVVDIPKL